MRLKNEGEGISKECEIRKYQGTLNEAGMNGLWCRHIKTGDTTNLCIRRLATLKAEDCISLETGEWFLTRNTHTDRSR